MEPGKTYHIYTHANGFENLFQSQENYRYFLRRYEHFIPCVADTLAWCLMPNHIHFLARIKTEEEIEQAFGKFETFQKLERRVSKQFANLFSSYTQAYNKMYSRRGSLFIHSFKRKEITSDSYLTNIIFYIHTNAMLHGFVKEFEAWPWSSYHGFLNEDLTREQQEITGWFGNREEFIKYHQQPIDLRTQSDMDF